MIARGVQEMKRRPTHAAKLPCSLLGECVIQAGTNADYKLLAPYHYRDHRIPPAVHQVYVAVHEPSQRIIGAIVYAAPAINLGARNRIFGPRYLISGASGGRGRLGGRGKGTNTERSGRLNREIELIIRVVIHPTFRGTGLGARLIRETMPLRPYRFIEMSAAMGAVNPFAEKAGMQAFTMPRPENTERVLAMLRSIGMTDVEIANSAAILRRVVGLPDGKRRFVEHELHRYALRWIKSRTKREVTITTEDAARRVAGNALLGSTYYLWEKTDGSFREKSPPAIDHAVFGFSDSQALSERCG